jgi:CspA family cold shock protein
MASGGTVREWDDAQGFGVIDSADTPGGCWVHFSHIVSSGYRTLNPADQVTFTFEAVAQDGFSYRAVRVWPPGVSAGGVQPEPDQGASGAYRSTLTIRWNDGTVTEGIPEQGPDQPPLGGVFSLRDQGYVPDARCLPVRRPAPVGAARCSVTLLR